MVQVGLSSDRMFHASLACVGAHVMTAVGDDPARQAPLALTRCMSPAGKRIGDLRVTRDDDPSRTTRRAERETPLFQRQITVSHSSPSAVHIEVDGRRPLRFRALCNSVSPTRSCCLSICCLPCPAKTRPSPHRSLSPWRLMRRALLSRSGREWKLSAGESSCYGQGAPGLGAGAKPLGSVCQHPRLRPLVSRGAPPPPPTRALLPGYD